MKPRRQGRGCSIPPPRQPHPRGVIPHRCTAGDLAVSLRSHLTPPKDPVSVPWHGHRANRQSTARPLGRGREEARNAPGGGGDPAKTVQRLRQETGEGDVPPPTPAGRFPMDTVSGDLAVSSRPHLTPPQRSCPSPGHGHRANRQTLTRPMEKTSSVKRSRQGGHQPALQPSIPHTSCPRTHPIICQAGDPGLTAG